MNFVSILVFVLTLVQIIFGNVTQGLEDTALLLSTDKIKGELEHPPSPQVQVLAYLEIEKKKTGRPLQIRSVSPKIVNGTDAAANEFPYQVQIRANGEHQCGGTVLSQDYILTAAHCFNGHPIESYEIIAGEHNTEENEGPEQARNIQSFTLHEDYFKDDNTVINDIAVVRLDHPLVLTPQVHPPILPEPDYDATGQLGVVSGWGHNETNGSVSKILQKVTLPIISNAACNEAYEGRPTAIPNTTICALYPGGGKDACQGDSGGPIGLKLENGSYLLVGIVSYGPPDCAHATYPGVYTRVSQFIQWIQAHTF